MAIYPLVVILSIGKLVKFENIITYSYKTQHIIVIIVVCIVIENPQSEKVYPSFKCIKIENVYEFTKKQTIGR